MVPALAHGVERASGHVHDTGAQGVHLAAELEAEHAVADIHEAGFGVLMHDLLRLSQQRERDLPRDRGHADPLAGVERGDRLTDRVGRQRVERRARIREQRRHALAALGHLGAQPVQAHRVHGAEGAHLPAVAPLHRAVDRGHVVRELWRERAGVVELLHDQIAQELAVLVADLLGLGHTRRSGELADLVDLRRGEATEVLVLERLPVKREDLLAVLLVEAGLGLVAESTALHELMHERHQREVLTGGLREAGGHVHEHVEAGEIAGAEGRGLGARDERPRERVDLGDGEVVLHHQSPCDDHAVHSEPIGDEAGHVLGEDDALAKDALLKVAHAREHLGERLIRGDELEQVHVARRIEVVRAEEALAELLRSTLQQDRHRDPRRVRSHDRVRGELFELGEELLLGLRLLDDRFDDPTAVGEEREMVGGVSDDDASGRSGVEEGGGLGLPHALESVARWL